MTTGSARQAVIASLAASLANRLTGDVLKVAVDGVDAAGKTVFADELAAELLQQEIGVVRASIDGFHNPAAIRHARDPLDPARSYYEDSFDYSMFRRCVLEPLGPDGDRWISPVHFDHLTDSTVAADKVHVSEGSVLVVDGIFLGRRELAEEWDIWVFLTVSTDVARTRGVARDGEFLGAGAEDRYRRRYEAGQRLYVAEADPLSRADIVVDNNDLQSPRVVRSRL